MEFDIIKSANNVENVLCTIESDTEDSAIEIAHEKALYYIGQHAPIHAEDQWVIRFDGAETIIQNDGEEIIFKVEECDNAEDLMYAIVQQGSDPYMIENIEQAIGVGAKTSETHLLVLWKKCWNLRSFERLLRT